MSAATDSRRGSVTVYVPCFDAARFLRDVLPALGAQTHPIDELLVVDDGSRDGTAELAERLLDEIGLPHRVLRHAQNQGLGAARNTAVRAARTEFVASVDADVRAEPDWLAELVAELADPAVVGVGGDLRESFTSTWADHWRDTHMRQSHGDARRTDPRFLFGCNTLFRRDALIGAGLYDERCRTNGEDFAISEALRDKGWQLVYTPLARCHHLRRDTTRSILRTYWRWAYFGNWQEVTAHRTFKSLTRNFKRSRRELLGRDLRAFDLSNLLLDVALPFHSGWSDLAEYRRRRRASN